MLLKAPDGQSHDYGTWTRKSMVFSKKDRALSHLYPVHVYK